MGVLDMTGICHSDPWMPPLIRHWLVQPFGSPAKQILNQCPGCKYIVPQQLLVLFSDMPKIFIIMHLIVWLFFILTVIFLVMTTCELKHYLFRPKTEYKCHYTVKY